MITVWSPCHQVLYDACPEVLHQTRIAPQVDIAAMASVVIGVSRETQ